MFFIISLSYITGRSSNELKSTKLPMNNFPHLYTSYSMLRSILSRYSLNINLALLNKVVIKKLNKSPLGELSIASIHVADVNKKFIL